MSKLWFCISCKHSEPIIGIPDFLSGLFGKDDPQIFSGTLGERYCPKCGKQMFQVEDKSSDKSSG
jgi:hypothetical protein